MCKSKALKESAFCIPRTILDPVSDIGIYISLMAKVIRYPHKNEWSPSHSFFLFISPPQNPQPVYWLKDEISLII